MSGVYFKRALLFLTALLQACTFEAEEPVTFARRRPTFWIQTCLPPCCLPAEEGGVAADHTGCDR